MSFASDKLYNGYLRKNMSVIVSKVKVREIIVHLPCLTAHDRETIEAKRETNGNYDSMGLLLECLKRRESWAEQFIKALEVCEYTTLAAEIEAEYDALRGVNNSNPSSPSTTVIRAHVHPAPSAPPAAQASPPPDTPVQPEARSSAAERAGSPQAAPPPEPAPEPLRPAPIEVGPSTPPPSPETPHSPGASTPLREVNAHQEPEENSEPYFQDTSNDNGVIPGEGEVVVNSVPTPPSPLRELDTQVQPDPLQTTATPEEASTLNANQEPEENSEPYLQDVTGDNVVIPGQASAEKSEVLVNSAATPPLSPRETDTGPDRRQTTASSEVGPPQRPTQANSGVTNGSSFPTLTPEKHPIQDTTPPEDKIPADVLEPEETPEPPTTQVVETRPQTDASIFDDTLCLSKPGQLVSIQPPNHHSPTLPAHNPPAEPYSGDSERLEMSDAAPDDVTVSSCSAVTSAATVSGLPCQENGIALNHDEPTENHYESPCQSLEGQEVLVNVVHVSEEPSLLNLDGQTSAPQAPLINGEAAREIIPSPPSTATDESPTSESPTSEQGHRPPEPVEITPALKALPGSEEDPAPRNSPTNRKYILTAAGVGACALLMAWKFKN